MSKVEYIEPSTQGQVLMLTNEKLGETPQLVACSFSEDFDFITRAFLDQPVKYMKKLQARDVFLVAHSRSVLVFGFESLTIFRLAAIPEVCRSTIRQVQATPENQLLLLTTASEIITLKVSL